MASGFGIHGGVGRCFAFWQEFSKCYAQTDTPSKCRAPAEDYLECLHHTKEIERAKELKAEFIRQNEHKAHESRKLAEIAADGIINTVGLLRRDDS
ncbi:uncharacterized protein BXZ73DRAFT_98278 [Epithele typhae]|uniref:uncharacterized protein n=1 Tax=Epithele typhae TaxID=378194 RepID=UPI0020080AC1|nr:uncharacterized protein BXZ73DRAFT_98278 [Epithele typhae]KAH9941890.1 hypothetical protein BXZ73DRAFT_98278 [Epithele typhae]